jgi:nucleotide-binding universal stress UspA family protein
MGLKDIVITIDAGAPGSRRLAYAIELARLHDARLTGLHVIEPLNLAAYFSPAVSGYIAADAMDEMEQRHRAAAEAAAKKLGTVFIDACSRAGITGEWRLAEGDIAEMGVRMAGCPAPISRSISRAMG